MAKPEKILLRSGAVRWAARVHRRGAVTATKRFKTQAEAEAWQRSVNNKVDRGHVLPAKTTSALTVAVVVDDYLNAHEIPSKQTGAYTTVAHDLGGFSVKALTKQHVRVWLKKLAETPVPKLGPKGRGRTTPYAASTRRKYFYALKNALEWHASEHGYALAPGMFVDQPVPASWDNPVERRITKQEESDLLEAAEGWGEQWPLLIRLDLETAARLQELALNGWENVHADGKSIHIPKHLSKTRRARSGKDFECDT